jgi:hypothetical protein
MRDHAASFRLGWIAVAVFFLGCVSGWGQSLSIRIGDQVDFHVPASLLLPLAGACVTVGAVIDPFGPVAATSVQPLRRLAVMRLALCLMVFIVGSVVGLLSVDKPVAVLMLIIRNASLLLGLSLAALIVLDLALAWIPACAYTIVCMAAGARPDGARASWAVLLEQDAQDAIPWVVSGAILIAGTIGILARLRHRQAR